LSPICIEPRVPGLGVWGEAGWSPRISPGHGATRPAAEAITQDLHGADTYEAMVHSVLMSEFLMRQERWDEAFERIYPMVEYCLESRRSDANTIHFVGMIDRISGALGDGDSVDYYGPLLMELLQRSGGRPGDSWVKSHRQHAAALRDLRRLNDAESLLREALEGIRPREQQYPAATALLRLDLARVLGMRGATAEAKSLLEQASPPIETAFASGDPEYEEYVTTRALLEEAAGAGGSPTSVR